MRRCDRGPQLCVGRGARRGVGDADASDLDATRERAPRLEREAALGNSDRDGDVRLHREPERRPVPRRAGRQIDRHHAQRRSRGAQPADRRGGGSGDLAIAASVTLGAARIERAPRKIRAGHTRTPFGLFTKFIAGNPIMPLITIGVVGIGVMTVFGLFATNNNGVEFFVESEPEQATVYVRARGNISLTEADNMVRQVEDIVMQHPGVVNVFSFAGDGGLNTDSSGNSTPKDTVGQVQFETIPWEDRPTQTEKWFFGMLERQISSVEFDGDTVIDELNAELAKLPGFEAEILALAQGPASGKPVHLRLKGDDFEVLKDAAGIARDKFENTPALTLIEDSRPLPGIDWQIDVDVEKAGRYGADVATVGAMVQLVTRGVLLDTMRVDTSDEEIEIRVRLPEEDRVLSTLDTLKVRTRDGLVPLSNFISRKPVAKLAEISRVDQQRYFDVKADFLPATVKFVTAAGTPEARNTGRGPYRARRSGHRIGRTGTGHVHRAERRRIRPVAPERGCQHGCTHFGAGGWHPERRADQRQRTHCRVDQMA